MLLLCIRIKNVFQRVSLILCFIIEDNSYPCILDPLQEFIDIINYAMVFYRELFTYLVENDLVRLARRQAEANTGAQSGHFDIPSFMLVIVVPVYDCIEIGIILDICIHKSYK